MDSLGLMSVLPRHLSTVGHLTAVQVWASRTLYLVPWAHGWVGMDGDGWSHMASHDYAMLKP